MIKFFRKIRENLLSEGKTRPNDSVGRAGKYLKYAFGEILLVVIGILIALQINNWNEERKIESQRQLLITSMIEDFEFNSYELSNTAIQETKSMLDKMKLFFDAVHEDTFDISVDSLKLWQETL